MYLSFTTLNTPNTIHVL